MAQYGSNKVYGFIATYHRQKCLQYLYLQLTVYCTINMKSLAERNITTPTYEKECPQIIIGG
jgi:hypothetical protein